jgi:hypothetical protein
MQKMFWAKIISLNLMVLKNLGRQEDLKNPMMKKVIKL